MVRSPASLEVYVVVHTKLLELRMLRICKQEDQEFKVILAYVVTSMSAWATGDLTSKTIQNKTKTGKKKLVRCSASRLPQTLQEYNIGI